MGYKKLLFFISFFLLPFFCWAGGLKGNLFTDEELYTFLAIVVFLVVNYPLSMILGYRAKKIRSLGLAIMALFLGSIYMLLWLVLIGVCIIERSAPNEIISLGLIVSIPSLIYTVMSFLEVRQSSNRNKKEIDN